MRYDPETIRRVVELTLSGETAKAIGQRLGLPRGADAVYYIRERHMNADAPRRRADVLAAAPDMIEVHRIMRGERVRIFRGRACSRELIEAVKLLAAQGWSDDEIRLRIYAWRSRSVDAVTKMRERYGILPGRPEFSSIHRQRAA